MFRRALCSRLVPIQLRGPREVLLGGWRGWRDLGGSVLLPDRPRPAGSQGSRAAPCSLGVLPLRDRGGFHRGRGSVGGFVPSSGTVVGTWSCPMGWSAGENLLFRLMSSGRNGGGERQEGRRRDRPPRVGESLQQPRARIATGSPSSQPLHRRCLQPYGGIPRGARPRGARIGGLALPLRRAPCAAVWSHAVPSPSAA